MIQLKVALILFQVGEVYQPIPSEFVTLGGPSVVFQHKYDKSYNNKNFVFRYRYPKSCQWKETVLFVGDSSVCVICEIFSVEMCITLTLIIRVDQGQM